jgi:hypothetical protein
METYYYSLRGHALVKYEDALYYLVNKKQATWEQEPTLHRDTMEDGHLVSELQAKQLYLSWYPKGKWVP